MNRFGRRLLALLVGGALLASGSVVLAPPAVAAANNPPAAPTGLRAELLADAVVVDTTEPSLSWVVNDSDPNEVQTAYRVVIAKTRADAAAQRYVHDTGWQESAQSSSVEVPGIEGRLEVDSLYFWQVQTKDGAGAQGPLSEPEPFNTPTAWADTRGAWLEYTEEDVPTDANRFFSIPVGQSAPGSLLDLAAGSGTGREPAAAPAVQSPASLGEWTNYAVEADLYTANALGVIFRRAGSADYMWQFRSAAMSTDANKVCAHTGTSYVKLDCVSATIPANTWVRVKIVAINDVVTTYVNGTLVDTRRVTTAASGTIGFRTGGSESGRVDNITVRNVGTGRILYADDFSTATGSAGFTGSATVTGGYLNVPTGQSGGAVLTVANDATLGTGLAIRADRVAPADASEWTNYAVDADLYVTATALGIVFRDDGTNNYMWQFKPSNNTLNYHAGRDYAAAVPANPASPTLAANTLALNKWVHVRIEAQGSTIRTYIDGALAGTVTDTNAPAGTIGLRTGSSESARVDNLVVQSLDTGRYLYAENAQGLALGQSTDFPGVSVATEQATNTVFPNFLFLRHSFQLDDVSDIERAVVSATGYNTQSSLASMADLFVNGEALGTYPARNHGNAPAGSLQYYNSYDVTGLLRGGENVIASLAYNRDAARAVLLQLTLWLKDGTKQVVTNSARDAAQWHALDGTPVFGTVLQTRNGAYYDQHSENLDAARYPFGFDGVGYTEDSAWRPVRLSSAINGTRLLAPFTAETTGRYWMPAASVTDRGSGTYVVTLDKEVVGSLELTIDSPAAQSITVKYAENLNSDGTVRLGGAGSGSYPPYQETWKLKAGQQTLRTYLMKNFRYLQIENSPVPITAEMVRGWAMRTAFDEDASGLSSSDSFLERLYEFTKYSMQATNQDLWVDSQARERGAYEGDAIVNFEASAAVSADYALGRHSAEYLVDNQTWPAEYKLFSVEVAWLDYLHTGNKDSLVEYYDKIKAKLNPSTNTSASGTFIPADGLVRTVGDTGSGNRVLVDWPTGEQDGYQFPNPGYSTPYNAIYVGAAQAMADIAGVVGNAADHDLWQDRVDAIKASMIARLYDPVKGAFADSMLDDGTVSTHFAQHSTAYALAYGIFDSPEMAAKLTAFLASQGGFKGSIYSSFFVLRGLFLGDGGETGLDFLLNPDAGNRRTFAHVLDSLKATISPEAWDPALKGNMTMSHPWGASPGAAIAHGMFGINPTKPAYEEFAVKFQPGQVGTAAITVPTLRGPVKASFDNTGTLFTGTVDVPANTTATVSLPASNPAYVSVAVDGEAVTATRAGGFLSVPIGSGHHSVAVSAEGAQLYHVALTPAADTVFASRTVTTTIAVTDEGEAPADLADAVISYESSDPTVATVDSAGVVTGVAEGDATIKVTVTKGTRTGFASVRIHVGPAPRITRLEVRAGLAAVGDLDTPQLVGIAEDGSEVAFTDVTFESSDPSVAEVRADGSVRVLAPGAFTLKARTKQHYEDLAPDFDFSAFEITPLWSADFDDGVNPFTSGPSNPTVVDGRLYVDKSKNAMLTVGSNWTDYVVTFTGEAVAGTSTNPLGEGLPVLVRARTNTPPGENYYWQVFASNNLKRGAGIAEVSPVTISKVNPAGTPNRIAIAAEGDRFMTYVNGRLVDTWTSGTYTQGTLGVRTGGTDARYYLDDIVVGTRVLTGTGSFVIAPDTAVLEALIEAAEGISGGLDGFTDASASALGVALGAAKEVAANPDDKTQAEIDEAVAALQSAMAGLELRPVVVPTPDKSVLRALYDGVTVLSNADGRYTSASWSALQAQITRAKSVLDDPAAGQAGIDVASTALGSALVGLEPVKTPPSKAPVVVRVKLGQSQLRLVKGKSFKVEEGVYYDGLHAAYSGRVTWRSSDPRVATVSSAGKVTARRVGSVTISATATQVDAAGRRLSASVRVTVVGKKPKVKVSRVRAVVPRSLRLGEVAYVT
ncbi:MAG: family 78 glycoside hydrolase catalytic domain, partial [Propionicimonas sp.]